MIKQEWKNIFHNNWIKIVLLAIVLIPSIYACVFLGSMWDPYGNSGDLPVAVVNEDKEVTYNDEKLNVGKELVEKLKDNDSLDFHFVSASKAEKGLEDGDYYMVITIPSDFSKNATTLLDDNPKKMVLNYTTNPGTNYVASKMDDTALLKIKSEVSSSVTETYAETIFESIDTLSNGFKDASDGTSELLDGMNQLSDGNKTISDNLKVLASSTLTFKNGTDTLTNGLKDYTDGVLTVHNGVYSLKQGINKLNNSTGTLSSGISQLNTGASSLQAGITLYTDSVANAASGSKKLVSYNDAINTGTSDLANGLDNLATGINTLASSTSSDSDLGKGLTELYSGSTQVTGGLTQVETGLDESITSSKKSLSELSTNVTGLNQSGKTLSDNAKALNGDNNANVEKLITVAKQLQSATTDETTKDYYTSLIKYLESSEEINTGIQSFTSATSQLTTTVGDSTSKSISSLETLKTNITALKDGSNGVTSGIKNVQTGVSKLNNAITKQVQPGVTKLQTGSKTLETSLKTYTSGVNDLNTGLQTIVGNNSDLTSGSKALSDGTKKLNDSAPALVSGVSQLNTGANKLYSGTSELTSNNSTLLSGGNQLSSGASQISSGASKLAAGSDTLGEGINSAKEGTSTLNDALKDGADESKLDTTTDTNKMMASPVETDHKEISTVTNNGHAMIPYMCSVGLYVACLAFTLMYPIRRGIVGAKNGFKYWLSKASVCYSVSTIGAIIMITALRFINGFEPLQLLNTYLFAILVSAAFMSIVLLLSMTTGFIGEFLLLVFMIVNLGGSAGTYPLDTAGPIYKFIHPLVPYTYSVDGFRKVISYTSANLSTEVGVLVGILVVCSILTIVYFQFKNKQDKHLVNEVFEKVNE